MKRTSPEWVVVVDAAGTPLVLHAIGHVYASTDDYAVSECGLSGMVWNRRVWEPVEGEPDGPRDCRRCERVVAARSGRLSSDSRPESRVTRYSIGNRSRS